MVRLWEQLFQGASDLSVDETDVITEGAYVASRTVATGVHDGEFMGFEPTGNEFELPGKDFYRIEDNKIAEAWVCVDSLGMMEHLGAMEPSSP